MEPSSLVTKPTALRSKNLVSEPRRVDDLMGVNGAAPGRLAYRKLPPPTETCGHVHAQNAEMRRVRTLPWDLVVIGGFGRAPHRRA